MRPADFDLPPDSVICQMTLESGKQKSNDNIVEANENYYYYYYYYHYHYYYYW